jgi:hypothetical protein
VLDSSIDVGVYGLYGLGLDGGNFFAGYTGNILELSTSGTYENAFAIGENSFLSARNAVVQKYKADRTIRIGALHRYKRALEVPITRSIKAVADFTEGGTGLVAGFDASCMI